MVVFLYLAIGAVFYWIARSHGGTFWRSLVAMFFWPALLALRIVVWVFE